MTVPCASSSAVRAAGRTTAISDEPTPAQPEPGGRGSTGPYGSGVRTRGYALLRLPSRRNRTLADTHRRAHQRGGDRHRRNRLRRRPSATGSTRAPRTGHSPCWTRASRAPCPPPYTYVTPQDWPVGGHPLGVWVADQRRCYVAGTLEAERVAELEALGLMAS
ncbi:helicase associated domain-containing protein [Streptomyces sp. NPDC006476]|uniref:helicase associated domain-containing protein n=1 Tax=Streptomyces sp. NPDC006476 TaxID=3157175 RepID=UPI00339E2289